MAIKTFLLFVTLTSLVMTNNISLSSKFEEESKFVECWKAFSEMKSCSNEMMNFLRDGKNSHNIISPHCCEAISLITHKCWPQILTAFGFTIDQTYLLRGYCDEEESILAYLSSAPTPAPI
ncbi:hypothetical protein M9H77_13098 [Catharanthus roseus]|uniref:Uncharacterized protein n=1 Tax=Catharanthus roseus TaxID=4058 RepID=A0ACC0BJD6_CATRO|nr:hypothetical protein M9H77_13098 [Catharanthus roseus]